MLSGLCSNEGASRLLRLLHCPMIISEARAVPSRLKATVLLMLSRQIPFISVGKPSSAPVSALGRKQVLCSFCRTGRSLPLRGTASLRAARSVYSLLHRMLQRQLDLPKRSCCISDFPCKLSPPLRLLGADVSILHMGPVVSVP